MGLDNLIYAMMGVAIFMMGGALGGIVEYYRSVKKIEDRDRFYIQMIEEITQTLYRVEGKIRIIHYRTSYVTDELREMKEELRKYDPEETQLLNVWSPEDRHQTPALPYQLSYEDYED